MNGLNVIKKCLEALSKESPDLSYVRGMLETFVEMNGEEVHPAIFVSNNPPKTPSASAQVLGKVDEQISPEEDAILKTYANGPIGRTA